MSDTEQTLPRTRAILWRQRLLWATIGALAAAAAFQAFSHYRSEGPRATAPREGEAPGERQQLFPAAEDPAEPKETECFLGVVVARDSVGVASENEGLLERVAVRVGDRVERGQVLAVLDTSNLRHQLTIEQAALAAAKARLSQDELQAGRARQEHSRRQEMSGLLSKEELETSAFQLETADARVEASKSEVKRAAARIRQLETTLERSEIRAPFAGTVAQRYLDPGSRVGPGTLILRLISSGGLLARFAVPPDRAERLKIGQTVRIELADLEGALEGSIQHRAPEIDNAAQMVFLEAYLDPEAEGVPIPSGAIARVAVLGEGEPPPSCLAG